MMDDKIYSAIVLKSKGYVFFINSYIILGTLLSGLLTWHFHILAILWIGSVLFLLLPIIAKRYFMNQFSEIKTFQFSKDSIIVSSKRKQQKTGDLFEIKVQDIESYKYEEGYGNPYLILYFNNGQKKSFDFQTKTIGEEHILNIILKYIRDFNHQNDKNGVIKLKPSFMATRNGLILLISLGIGWTLICIVLLVKNSKAIPFSVIGGIAMFIQTLILRNNALKSYREKETI